MSRQKKAAWNRCHDSKPKVSRTDKQIIAEYERGSKMAAFAFCAMFAFLAFGAVVFGW